MFSPEHEVVVRPEREIVLLGSRRTRATNHPQPTKMEVEPSQRFTSNYQAPQQQYQHQPAPFATGNTAAARAAWVGYPFGSSAQMPPGGWPSEGQRMEVSFNPKAPPFSGLRTPDPVVLSELGKLKEMCLELAYHSVLSFAMVYKREKTTPFFTDADEKKFRDIMRKLYNIIAACYNAGVLEDGNYKILPHIHQKLMLAFKWVDMYIVNLEDLENLKNPRWSDAELIHQANLALANSPHSDDVLQGQVAHLPFFQLLEEVFPQFQNETIRKNLQSEGSLAAAPFKAGGRGVRHKPKRHYKLTRRHKPKRHYKLTRRHKPKRHYKLTRRRKP
jgi:hypothetical protein